jgi:hypothetical protein
MDTEEQQQQERDDRLGDILNKGEDNDEYLEADDYY